MFKTYVVLAIAYALIGFITVICVVIKTLPPIIATLVIIGSINGWATLFWKPGNSAKLIKAWEELWKD